MQEEMRSRAAQEVLSLAEKQLQQRQQSGEKLPSFEEIVSGEQGAAAQDVQIKELYRQLEQLEKHSQLSLNVSTASSIPGGRFIKKIGLKLFYGIMAPVIRQQNTYNLEVASCIRSILTQLSQSDDRIIPQNQQEEK